MVLSKVESESFNEEILESKGPIVVEFWSSECDFCKRFDPVYKKLAENLTNEAKFVFMDVTEDQASIEIAMRCGVRAVPTLKIFYQGRIIGDVVGDLSYDKVEDKLQSILEKKDQYVMHSSPMKEWV
jgi:thioredoxin 1